MIMKIKTVNSTSVVNFQNQQRAFYDMIITISNVNIDQTVNILDTEGNPITVDPLTFSQSVQILLKSQPVGSISLSDTNVYNVYISYKTVESSESLISLDFSNNLTTIRGNVKVSNTYQSSFVSELATTTLVPNGKVWKIKSIAMEFEASATTTYFLSMAVIPPNNVVYPTSVYALFYDSVDLTLDDSYSVLLSIYGNNQTLTSNPPANTIVINLPKEIELFSNDFLYLDSSEPQNTTYFTIEYTEESIS